ncbi:MAG: lysozyme [Bryobacteraceae bacterium]
MVYITSNPAVELIKQFEGLKLDAYNCPAGVLTIGYGHTGTDVVCGMKITAEEADRLLRNDLRHFEKRVQQLVTVPLTQGQFDALVSFAFNVGLGALERSTLLRKLNAEDYRGAAEEFGRWTKAAGKELPGLVRRRRAERQLFEEVDVA